MDKVTAVEGKIKRLKKTISDLDSGKDQSEGVESRLLRKQLKRLQRRRRVILSTAASFKPGKASEGASPGGKEDKGASQEGKKDEAKPVKASKEATPEAEKKEAAPPKEKSEKKAAAPKKDKGEVSPAETKEEAAEGGK
ncbi:MAG TPA: hypothetical protein VIU33_06265 [Nitrospiria bacterium]